MKMDRWGKPKMGHGGRSGGTRGALTVSTTATVIVCGRGGVAILGAPRRGAKPTPKFKAPTNPPQRAPTSIPDGTRIFRGKPTQQYPNGYWKLEKFDGQGWQRLDPRTMKPGPHPDTHIPFPDDYLGPFDN